MAVDKSEKDRSLALAEEVNSRFAGYKLECIFVLTREIVLSMHCLCPVMTRSQSFLRLKNISVLNRDIQLLIVYWTQMIKKSFKGTFALGSIVFTMEL